MMSKENKILPGSVPGSKERHPSGLVLPYLQVVFPTALPRGIGRGSGEERTIQMSGLGIVLSSNNKSYNLGAELNYIV